MKVNRSLDKLLGLSDCDFIGFDSFEGFGNIKSEDKHPMFNDKTFSVDEKKVLKNIKKCAKGQRYQIIKGFYDSTIKDKLPTGTIIGSPNYGWRSVMRDSESQIFLHTYDRKLQQALSDEWNSMEKESVAVDENVFKVSGRHTDQYFSWKQGHWIGIGSRLVKTFM